MFLRQPFLALTALTVSLGLGMGSTLVKESVQPSVAVAQSAPSTIADTSQTFQEFSSAEGSFSVLMPSAPIEGVMTFPAGKERFSMYGWGQMRLESTGGIVMYGVGYMDAKADIGSSPDKVAQVFAGFTKTTSGGFKPIGRPRQITLDGYSGQEIKWLDPKDKTQMVGRIYIAGQRVYFALIANYPIPSNSSEFQAKNLRADFPQASADTFLNSFHILNASR